MERPQQHTNADDRDREQIEVKPKWFLSGHTMKWIVLNIISFGMVAVFTVGLSLVPIVLAFIRRNDTRYTLSEGRLHLVETSLLGSETTNQIPVRDVTDIKTEAGIFQRFFSVGTVSFREGDGAYSKHSLKGIPRHKELAEEIGRRQNEEAKQTRYRS